jgi:hypothetical protein
MGKRNRYTPEFKAKTVMEVLREEETVNRIAGKYSLSPDNGKGNLSPMQEMCSSITRTGK